jgi:hypothetical protein
MKNSLILLLTISLLLTSSPVVLTQTRSEQSTANENAQEWQELFALRPGTKVLVELKNGTKGEGKVLGTTSRNLTLFANPTTYTFEQRSIQKVYGFKGISRSKAAKIGAVIGTLAGTFIGAGIAVRNESKPGRVSSDKDTLPAFLGFFIGAAAGTCVGSLFGGRQRKELLYEAK